MSLGVNVKGETQIYQSDARGRKLCVQCAAKTLHVWIDDTVNCFL